MTINDLLLESSNRTILGSGTFGAMVAATGKKKLWSDRRGKVTDVTVIHYTSAINRFPDDPFNIRHMVSIFCEYGVSSHFLIDREGGVFRLVPVEKKAWHCGGSIMPAPDNRTGVNDFSVGIELLAVPDGGFTEQQYAALARLCCNLEQTVHRPMTYVGHEDIAGEHAVALGLRTDCKVDPGPLFSWHRFMDDLAVCRKQGSTIC
jgi:N-acetyl-anhydromuramyl-L-alanine amidase AmpD